MARESRGKEFWSGELLKAEASGLKLSKYAELHDLGIHNLTYWRRKLSNDPKKISSSQFSQVRVQSSCFKITLSCGTVIESDHALGPIWIRSLLGQGL